MAWKSAVSPLWNTKLSNGNCRPPRQRTDSRTANWDGLGQVELDAVKPEKLIAMLDDALGEIFDNDLYDELNQAEEEERELFQTELRRYVTEEI